MIRGYSDHAANERTFLAWVRAGIAVIAFGFVIEKFNLFLLKFNLLLLTVANPNLLDAERRLQLERLSEPLGRYDGLALILLGIAIVVVAATLCSYRGSCSMTRKHVGGVRAVAFVDDGRRSVNYLYPCFC